MALQKQIIPIPFAQGANTKTDPKQLPPGSLTLLQNGIFITPQQIRKRNGFAPLTNAVSGGGVLGQGQGLALYNSELLAFDTGTMYSYDPGAGQWINKGSFVSTSVGLNPIARNTRQYSQGDGAVAPNGVGIYAWTDSTSGGTGVFYSIFDTTTQQFIVANAQDATNMTAGVNPHCFILGGYLLVVYQKSAAILQYMAIPYSNPKATPTTGAIVSNVGGASAAWDGTIFQGGATVQVLRLAYYNNVGGTTNISTATLDQNLVATSIGTVTGTGVPVCLAAYNDGTLNKNWYVSYATTAAVRSFSFTASGSVNYADTVNATQASVFNIVGIYNAGLGGPLTYYTIVTGTSNNATVGVTLASGTGGAYVFQRHAALAAKPFNFNGQVQLPLVYSDATGLQGTNFIIQYTGTFPVQARYLSTLGGLANPHLPSISNPFLGNNLQQVPALSLATSYQATQTGIFRHVAFQRDQLTTQVTAPNPATAQQTVNIVSTYGVTDCVINFFNSQSAYSNVTAFGVMHFGGGYLQMYDGTTPVEHGFHLYPSQPAAPTQGTGGQLTLLGTYQVCFVYAWTDNTGRTHRSTPSIPNTVTLTGANNLLTFAVPTLSFTGKTNVVIEAYRTANNGTAFYRETNVTATTAVTPIGVANNTGVDTVNVTVGSSTDAAIVGGQALYTAGGVLPNTPMPSCSSLVTFAGRVVGIQSEFPLNYQYSQQGIAAVQGVGNAAAFSPYLIGSVDPVGGSLTALGSMDDKLLLFKASKILYVQGSGPDSTGNNNSFSGTTAITTDVGCTNQRSIVLSPIGILFQSAKGIYLCDRSLQVSYIGAPMEAYVQGNTVVSAVLMAGQNQIRFGLNTGITVVYDYFVEQWSVFTNQPQVAAINYLNNQALLTPGITVSGVYQAGTTFVSVETPGAYSDNGQYIPLLAQTGWLNLAGIGGFQRLYSMIISGDYKGTHTIQVSAAYDNNPAPSETRQLNVGNLYPTGVWGGDVNWGASTPWGGTFPQYVFRYDPMRQKCTSVQITIQDVQTGLGNEGCALSALTFLAGVKPGVVRLPSTQQLS